MYRVLVYTLAGLNIILFIIDALSEVNPDTTRTKIVAKITKNFIGGLFPSLLPLWFQMPET